MNKIIKGLILLICVSPLLFAQNIEQGEKLLEIEKYSDAKKIFEDISKADPKNTEALFYLGEIAIADSQYNQAENYFKSGLSIDKESALNQIGLGHIKLMKGDSLGAKTDFEEAIDNDEDNIKVYLQIGNAYLNSPARDVTWAAEQLTNSKKLKNQKKNPKIFGMLGDLYVKMNNGTLARENYQNAIYADKNFIKGYLGVSGIYLRVKNYPDAEAYLNDALAIDSTYSITYRDYAEFYYTVKQYDKAANMYKKYLDNSEITHAKRSRYATMLYLAKRYAEAVELLKSIQNTPEFGKQEQHILAFCYSSLEDAQNGIPAFQNYFSQIKPGDISSTDYEYYGTLQEKAGNDSLAIENYKKAVELDSSKSVLYGQIASIYFKNKDYANSARYFGLKEANYEKKLSLREYFDYGRALMLAKEFSKADSVFATVTTDKPDLPLGYLMRARSNSSIDTTSESGLAKPHYEKFIQLATQSADSSKYTKELVEAYSYLGYFYYLKKDDPEYKDTWLDKYAYYWNAILKLDPENKRAQEALKNVKK